VASEYHLIRPIFGFWSDGGHVITIPAKSTLRIVITKNGLGLCTAIWDSRLVMAFSEDIKRNSISLEPLGDTSQFEDPIASQSA
jgi:hypothetical protein